MVICLELGNKILHMVKLMSLPPYHLLLKIHASSGISCHLSSCVCLSVTSRCSTETPKCRITQTVPYDDGPGTLVF